MNAYCPLCPGKVKLALYLQSTSCVCGRFDEMYNDDGSIFRQVISINEVFYMHINMDDPFGYDETGIELFKFDESSPWGSITIAKLDTVLSIQDAVVWARNQIKYLNF
jgi:hypothetical protein